MVRVMLRAAHLSEQKLTCTPNEGTIVEGRTLINIIRISRRAKRDIQTVPKFIVDKLLAWTKRVEKVGLEEVRKIKGYHDEPLHGQRHGQRSIRLSRAYRAIYIILHDGSIKFVSVEEVNKHEY